MKKKLLVLLIAAIPMLMPNLASAIHIDIFPVWYAYEQMLQRQLFRYQVRWLIDMPQGLKGQLHEKETTGTTDCSIVNIDAELCVWGSY